MAQATLKLTHQEAIVKVWPETTDEEGDNTIALDDLVSDSQVIDEEGTVRVNIAGVTWFGDPAAVITVTRGDTVVMTLPCTGANEMDLTGQDLPPDTVENEEDLEVTFTGGIGQVYLKLRKATGYITKVEDATYGAYDDPTRVGASTTMSGSPDKE